MPDYAGAAKAIRDKFAAEWAVLNPTVPIQNQNTDPPSTEPVWPPVNKAWIYLEVLNTNSEIRGAGKPGNQVWLYTGNIFIHIFVPLNYGIEDLENYAVQAGEIFRAKTFYNAFGTGVKLICGAPQISGGTSDADQGSYFRVTCSIPFEYYHVG